MWGMYTGAAAPQKAALPVPNPPLTGLVSILTRREVLAICASQYCQSWGMYGLLNWLPTFFKDFYHVEIADLASYTLMPYVLQGALGAASGVLAGKRGKGRVAWC